MSPAVGHQQSQAMSPEILASHAPKDQLAIKGAVGKIEIVLVYINNLK